MKKYFLIVLILGIILFINGCNKEQVKNVDMLSGNGEYEVTGNEVNYFENSKGFLAKPEQEGNYPGVVMIHEWWGLNDNIREMAKELASNGYVVLAVDLYNGQVASTTDQARQLVSSLDSSKAIANMKAAVNYLRNNENAGKIASLGWCFGGGQSLQLALSGEQLNSTVIYYGNLVTEEAKLNAIKWPVLGIFGDKDASIPVDNVNKFRDALDKIGVENDVYIYPGVGHAFANPSGMNYAADEARDAWEKTVAFLDKNLK